MCSLTAAMIGLTVGQTGLQMAAQHQQTKAAVQTAEAQAKAAEQNAKIQNRQSELIAEQYNQKERELDARRKLIQGAQRAEAGAAGIAGGVGSSMDMLEATTDAWMQDKVNLLGGQRDAVYNNYIKEVNYRNQAHAYRAQADAAKQAGRMAQWGTLLSGAASLYGLKMAQGTSAAAKSTSAGIASTPTAAGVVPQAYDLVNSGINTGGWLPKLTKTSIGSFNSFGAPKLAAKTYF